MIRELTVVSLVTAVFAVRTSATLTKYKGHEICGRTIHLGYSTYGFQVDYNMFGTYKCETRIEIHNSYSSAFKIMTFDALCNHYLFVEYYSETRMYELCSFDQEEEIPAAFSVTLRIVTAPHNLFYNSTFSLLFYVYDREQYGCSSSSLMCNNGRCVHRDLYCNPVYNFCGDDTYRECYVDNKDSGSGSYGSIVGFIALILTLCLVVVVVGYFCCCRPARRNQRNGRNGTATRNGRTLPTARDVFTIPTSHDNPDGIDYVIDYQKYLEPPAYDTLEMTTISSPGAHAHVINSSGGASETVINAEVEDGSNTTAALNEQASGASLYTTINDSTAEQGVRNEGFVEDELPSYNDVVSNEERFAVESDNSRSSSNQ